MAKNSAEANKIGNYTIRYVVSGGYPPVDARLGIENNGQAELFIGSSWSLPVEENREQPGSARVGVFGGPLALETRASLNTLATGLCGRQFISPPSVPDTVFRLLQLSCEGQETKFELAGSVQDPALEALEAGLKQVMVVLATQPVHAVQAAVSVRLDGDQIKPEVAITNIGARTVRLFLQNPANSGQAASMSLVFEEPVALTKDFTAWNPYKTIHILPAQLLNQLPVGKKQLGPNEAASFSLPSISPPATGKALYVSGHIQFWLAGMQAENHLVQVRTVRTAVGTLS